MRRDPESLPPPTPPPAFPGRADRDMGVFRNKGGKKLAETHQDSGSPRAQLSVPHLYATVPRRLL